MLIRLCFLAAIKEKTKPIAFKGFVLREDIEKNQGESAEQLIITSLENDSDKTVQVVAFLPSDLCDHLITFLYRNFDVST